MANKRWVIERSEVTAERLSCSVKLAKKCTGESFARKNSVQETSVG